MPKSLRFGIGAKVHCRPDIFAEWQTGEVIDTNVRERTWGYRQAYRVRIKIDGVYYTMDLPDDPELIEEAPGYLEQSVTLVRRAFEVQVNTTKNC